MTVGQDAPTTPDRSRNRSRSMEDLGQADVEDDHGKQEEGEEAAVQVHPDLCWLGRGQLWTKGQGWQVLP